MKKVFALASLTLLSCGQLKNSSTPQDVIQKGEESPETFNFMTKRAHYLLWADAQNVYAGECQDGIPKSRTTCNNNVAKLDSSLLWTYLENASRFSDVENQITTLKSKKYELESQIAALKSSGNPVGRQIDAYQYELNQVNRDIERSTSDLQSKKDALEKFKDLIQSTPVFDAALYGSDYNALDNYIRSYSDIAANILVTEEDSKTSFGATTPLFEILNRHGLPRLNVNVHSIPENSFVVQNGNIFPRVLSPRQTGPRVQMGTLACLVYAEDGIKKNTPFEISYPNRPGDGIARFEGDRLDDLDGDPLGRYQVGNSIANRLAFQSTLYLTTVVSNSDFILLCGQPVYTQTHDERKSGISVLGIQFSKYPIRLDALQRTLGNVISLSLKNQDFPWRHAQQ